MTIILVLAIILSSLNSAMSILILYKFARKEGVIKKDIRETLFPSEVQVYKGSTFWENLLKEEYANSMN